MVQLQPKLLTVREFIDHFGDTPQYELIDGELIDLEPTGIHGQVAAFIGCNITNYGTGAIRTRDLPLRRR